MIGISVSGKEDHSKGHSKVLQGSVLEPVLFKTVTVTWERKMSSETGISADNTKLFTAVTVREHNN